VFHDLFAPETVNQEKEGVNPDHQPTNRYLSSLSERDNMTLGEYFKNTGGFGVLATTDAAAQVDQAIYSKPLFLDKDDDGTCSFIMSNRLTHDNVEHNPSASYLFIEDGGGFVGKRLSLVIVGEETDSEKIKAIRDRTEMNLPLSGEECKYLVHFHIEGVRPLCGNT
jgi:hypothetical protein